MLLDVGDYTRSWILLFCLQVLINLYNGLSFYKKYTIINHYHNITGKVITANSIHTAYNKTCVYLPLTSLNIRKKIYCVYVLHNFFNL